MFCDQFHLDLRNISIAIRNNMSGRHTIEPLIDLVLQRISLNTYFYFARLLSQLTNGLSVWLMVNTECNVELDLMSSRMSFYL